MKEKYGELYQSELDLMDPKISTGCGAGQREITVNTNGMMKICAIQPSVWFNFGHIMDLESPAAQGRFSSFSKLPSPGIESCKGCEHLTYCMNCYTRAFNLLTTRAIEPDRCNWYQQNAALLRKLEIQ